MWASANGRRCGPLLLVLALGGGSGLIPTGLEAQGVATVAIRGTVRMADGTDPTGARVVVRSEASGFVVETEPRRGAFLIEGLEPGGPYTITVRRIGAIARRVEGVVLGLGAPLELHVTLTPSPLQLDSLEVTGRPAVAVPSDGGIAARLPDSLLHRLPSLNRDVYDFLRLVPQVSTRIGFTSGISAGGSGFRANNFLTNGVPERSLLGAQPPEFAGSRSLPFDAVREYQVLVTPFDVRYGDFTGAMVNTVTRAGGNRWAGSAFLHGRGDALARGRSITPYERWQTGLSFSGPLWKNRVQAFVATEVQALASPMNGPYLGQSPGGPPVPVGASDVERLDAILRAHGLTAGSGGAVSNRNRQLNGFGRIDAALPELGSRAVFWVNGSRSRTRAFSRASSPDSFALSSAAADRRAATRTIALQVITPFRRAGGGSSELSVSHRSTRLEVVPGVTEPLIQVTVPRLTGGFTTLVAGAPIVAHGAGTAASNVDVRETITLPVGRAHALTLGVEAEWFRAEPLGIDNGFGTWTFASLDSLEAGRADRFEVARDFGSGRVPISGWQLGSFLGDRWDVSPRFSVTGGVRGDLLSIDRQAPRNAAVEAVLGARTDRGFEARLELSPRVGFAWELPTREPSRLRGGIGLFTGRPPLAWLHVPLQNYGDGIGTLRCGDEPNDIGAPPPFAPDPFRPPTVCAGGQAIDAPVPGDVELVAPNLRMARALRAALGYERRLPGRLQATVEALVTRHLTDFAFVNRNLVGLQSVDRTGRVRYGTFDASGRATPARISDSFPSVIEIQNVGRNHAIQLSSSLRRQSDRLFVSASYTFTRARDAGTPLRVNTRGFANWSLRATSGRHDAADPGISLNDVPHRIVVAATWRTRSRRWPTDVSFLYVGESGSPFTWRAGGVGRRGDLNADGALNDPVYVPTSAGDPAQIRFSGLSSEPGADNSSAVQADRVTTQRVAFDAFIEGSDCLRRQRGRILERNSCREPWAATTVATIRQAIPIAERAIEVELDVFNVLNLFDRDWGLRRGTGAVLLEHVGQTVGSSGEPEPVFRFNAAEAQWRIDPVESTFQLQLGLRYRF